MRFSYVSVILNNCATIACRNLPLCQAVAMSGPDTERIDRCPNLDGVAR
jgi:hypothetical protein